MTKTTRTITGWVVALVAAGLIFSSLHSDTSTYQQEKSGKTIQLIVPSSKGTFWENALAGVQAAVEEYGVTIYSLAPEEEEDINVELQKAMQSLAGNPDAIVLAASDDSAFGPFLKEAAKRRIPVIAIESPLTSGKTASYIGIDHEAAGAEAVRQLAESLGGRGNIAIVASAAGSIDGSLREKGIRSRLASYPSLRLAGRVQCSEDESECQQVVGHMLDSQKIDGLIALSPEASAGAALELKRRQASGSIALVGFGSSPELLDLLQTSQIRKLIVQNSFSLGYLGVKTAVEAAEGRRVAKGISMDVDIVDKQNMFWMRNQKLLFPVVQK